MIVYTRRLGERYHFSKACATAGREWCEEWVNEVPITEAEEDLPPCRNCVVPRV